ncbi:MAG TPA: lysophospholipid acyltransferase family protein [Vicinamibacteria bacterium]
MSESRLESPVVPAGASMRPEEEPRPLWLAVLAGARSAFAVALLLVWMVVGGGIQRLVFWPSVRLLPGRRQRLVALYMKMMSGGILGFVRLGGARVERPHRLPTDEPLLVVMNHQSLLDIPTVVLLSSPFVPRFIARARYGRYIPAVSLCIRELGCPLIEPSDRRGSLETLRRAAREQVHGLLIYPEGHRTRDGGIQPFRTAGLELILRERPVPVYAVVTDGFWECRRLVDVVFKLHRIQGRTEVLGPFPPPSREEIPAFLADLRERMVRRLEEMRSARRA